MPAMIASLTPTRVIAVCRLLIGVQVVLRLLVFGAGFFYWDDYVLQGRAALSPLLAPDFLFYIHNGHIMPSGMLLTGVLERLAPLNYWPVLFTLILLQFLATWLTYRLIRSLIGPRPALLGVVAILALTPMTLLPGAWWSAAINFLPLQIGAAVTGIMILKACRGGSKWWQVGAVLALVFSLSFFEKSILIPLIALAVGIAVGPSGRGLLPGLWSVIRCQWLYFSLATVVVVSYLTFYLERVASQTRTLMDSAGIVILTVETVVRGLVPAMVGGPLSYEAAGFGSALADPNVLVSALALILAVAFISYGLIQSARSRALWILVGAWIGVDLVILAVGRGGFDIILTLGTSLRYTVDALVIIMIAVAITVASPAGQDESRVSHSVRGHISRITARHPVAFTAASLSVVAVALGAALVSHVTLMAPLADNASRMWLMNIRKAALERPQGINILEGPVPFTVYDSLGYPNNQFSHVLAPLRDDVRVTDVIAEPIMFDDQGRLVAASVRGIDSFPGPDGDCGWAVTDQPVTIPIDGNLFPWQYTLRLRYLAPNNASVPVQLGQGEVRDIDVLEGANEAILIIDGDGSTVTVGPYGGPQGICVAQVSVGDLVPRD
jgi:hypothetical protein